MEQDREKYNVEEYEEINAAFADKDLIRIFMLKMGIYDRKSLDGIEHADDRVIADFLLNVFISDDFVKLVKYLRS